MRKNFKDIEKLFQNEDAKGRALIILKEKESLNSRKIKELLYSLPFEEMIEVEKYLL